MTDTVLVLIKSDPLKSHRPVEGLRIALGLAAGEHSVVIVLLNQAPLLLGDDYEDLVDGELLQKYLPVLKGMDQTFFVEEDSFRKLDPEETDYKIEAVPYGRISELVRTAGRFIIF